MECIYSPFLFHIFSLPLYIPLLIIDIYHVEDPLA